MKKKHLFILFTAVFSGILYTFTSFAGSGTEADPYTIAEARALSEGATMYWAQGYIVGGRYNDFDPPYNNDYGISCADSDTETDVNNCLQVKLEAITDYGRADWGLNSNPDKVGTYIKFHGFRDTYGGYPSFEGVDNIQEVGSGPSEDDPNISVTATVDFGRIAPGTVSTQLVLVSNTGSSQVLNVTAVLPVSGDTGIITVGALPGGIAAGNNDSFPFIYTPGDVTGATHSAVYDLICNDPSDPTNTISISAGTEFGTLRVYDIQYTTDPSGDSPLLGNEITVAGIVTYIDPFGFCIADEGGGPWSGVYVYDYFYRPHYGEKVEVTATVDEYYNLTELKDVAAMSVLDTDVGIPVTTVSVSQANMEDYEGVLVHVDSVTVNSEDVGGSGYVWQVNDGANDLLIEDICPYRYIWELGQSLDAIRGVMMYNYSERRLSPRYDDDFIGRPVKEYALKGCVITPEGPKSNWYVQVWDDDIVAVTDAPPADVTIVDTDGIIFPGLIDAHNHPGWNSFPTLMFNNFPYGHRDEWGSDDPEYDDWKAKRGVVRSAIDDSNTARISKWSEILEMMAGCITIQGNYDGKEYAHPDVMLFNIEQFPSRIFADIFAWTMSTTERSDLLGQIAGGRVNAVLIHLCEGPDATSHAQFSTWKNWGMLTEETAIIHGTPLTASDFTDMAAVGAKVLWSPMSNMKLYEETCNVKLAHQNGVLVGLSPDWTPSGGYNMLEELAYAWYLNETMFDNYFTPRQMCDMVTSNNAAACGFAHKYGIIKVGHNAGFCVIDGDVNDPYMSLINARPSTVKLTIIDGMPRYGDTDLVNALGETNEVAMVSGVEKTFNVAFDHPFLDHSTETVASIRSALQSAHGTLFPSGELDTDELQFLDFDLLQKGPDNIVPFRADNPIVAPANGAELTIGSSETLSFRRQDFWDNMTDSRVLVQKEIGIVRASAPSTVVQVIATNVVNYTSALDKHVDVTFTPAFIENTEDCYFRFLTEDLDGNVRTSVFTDVGFSIIPEPGIMTIGALVLGLFVRMR